MGELGLHGAEPVQSSRGLGRVASTASHHSSPCCASSSAPSRPPGRGSSVHCRLGRKQRQPPASPSSRHPSRKRGPGASSSRSAGQVAAQRAAAASAESRPSQRARPSLCRRLPCDAPISWMAPGPSATWPLSIRVSNRGRPASSEATCSSCRRKAATQGFWRSCDRVARESSRRVPGNEEAASLGCAVNRCSRSRESWLSPSPPQHNVGQLPVAPSRGSKLNSCSLLSNSPGHFFRGASRVLLRPQIASSRRAGKRLNPVKVCSSTPRHSRRSSRTS
mmetsp:Transcript_93568/g.274032  ORF Transcript_93568/g.274032 Transcript_93568/m.274032 type:complete len:278 (-) Transcript_93568:897-1730(-)